MRRRDFFSFVAAGGLAWPLAARAGESLPLIGVVSAVSDMSYTPHMAAFRQGLRESGIADGHQVLTEYCWAAAQSDQLPALVTEYVNRSVAVIVAFGGAAASVAAKTTTAIPVVFLSAFLGDADPVQHGLVASHNRPGRNVTGVAQALCGFGASSLALIREIVPAGKAIGVLANPENPDAARYVSELQELARAAGQTLVIARATSAREAEAAFVFLQRRAADALLVIDDPVFGAQRAQLAALAARHALPTVYCGQGFATAGGLVSYGPNQSDLHRLVGVYAGRVLNGADPAKLPVLRPMTSELVINMKTAQTLGLAMPAALLARADRVID
jgi:putative ABC transport system substrate-binding protein